MVWPVLILAENNSDVLVPVSAETPVSSVVQWKDWSQICLRLTQNKGTTQPTITTQFVCVCVLTFF